MCLFKQAWATDWPTVISAPRPLMTFLLGAPCTEAPRGSAQLSFIWDTSLSNKSESKPTTRLVPHPRVLGQIVSNVHQSEAQSKPKPKKGREACLIGGFLGPAEAINRTCNYDVVRKRPHKHAPSMHVSVP